MHFFSVYQFLDEQKTVQGKTIKKLRIGHWISFLCCRKKVPQTGSLNNIIYCLTVLETRSLRLRCQQDWFLLGAVKENLFHASLLVSGSFKYFLACRWHFPYVFTSSSLCTRVSLFQISPFDKDISHIGLERTLTTLSSLDPLQSSFFQIRSYSQVLGD